MARHKTAERDQARSETRQRLLEAAIGELGAQGYAGANINRIAENAGYAKGTIYNYFPSKRALMLALIDQVAAEHLAFVAGEVRQQADPVLRLQLFFAAGFAFVTERYPKARVMMTTANGPDAEFKAYMFQAYQPMFQLVELEIIATGIEQGVFRRVDPAATASLLMTIYLGTASQLDPTGRVWLRPEEVADFALHALRAEKAQNITQTEVLP